MRSGGWLLLTESRFCKQSVDLLITEIGLCEHRLDLADLRLALSADTRCGTPPYFRFSANQL